MQARRYRLGLALGASLLLHGGGLVWWWTDAPPPQPDPAPQPTILWVRVMPEAAPTAAVLVAPQQAAPSPASAARPRVRPAAAPSAALPAATLRMATHDRLPTAGSFLVPEPPAAPASEAHASPAALPAPSMDDVAQALQRERAWQRRQGVVTAQPWAGARPGSGPEAAAGAQGMQDLRRGDGSRIARVSGPTGEYCVNLPSANQLPTMGAAPRIAPVSNCR